MHFTQIALYIILLKNLNNVSADFLGPTYPAPRDLTSDKSLISTAWANLTSTLDGYLTGNHSSSAENLKGVENITFSAGLFSLHDAEAIKLQYHYTSSEITDAKAGLTKVDGDSIYRVASVSKLITAYAGLVELSDEDWHRPLTEFFPGLFNTGDDLIYNIQWETITPWALAAQQAGIPQLAWPIADKLAEYGLALLTAPEAAPSLDPVTLYGFPPSKLSDLGPCTNVTATGCPTEHYIASLRAYGPTFLPWSSPGYTDSGFFLLGLILSNVTGKLIETVYRESIFDPLSMDNSTSVIPTDEAKLRQCVIPGDPRAWGVDGNFSIPSGGLLSTLHDLDKLGLSILNATLLPANVTRKWMKPLTHTPSFDYSAGAPWEIARWTDPSSGQIIDLYTKLGDSGTSGAAVVIIPDFDVGFSFLAASSSEVRSGASNVVLDYITEAVLPALKAQSLLEAQKNYVGTYASTDPNLNSSVIISFNESTVKMAPRSLSISSWISNGTDALASPLFASLKPRLLPSIPNQNHGPGQVAFQASSNNYTNSYTKAAEAGIDGIIGPFTGQYKTNFDWLVAAQQNYGARAINLFVFDVDEKGRATAVSPAVTRAKLQRKA